MAGRGFFTSGGRVAWGLIIAVLLAMATSTLLLANTAEVRMERDVARMVFNDNVDLLEDVKRTVSSEQDSLSGLLSGSPEGPRDAPYIVVSLAENRLWYKQGDRVLFETRVASGSGKTLVKEGGTSHHKFDTPRGRLIVQRKDLDPQWVLPDWHFIEQARKRGLGLARLNRGQELPTSDGAVITVAGNDVVKRYPDGRTLPHEAQDGRE